MVPRRFGWDQVSLCAFSSKTVQLQANSEGGDACVFVCLQNLGFVQRRGEKKTEKACLQIWAESLSPHGRRERLFWAGFSLDCCLRIGTFAVCATVGFSLDWVAMPMSIR